MYDSVNAAALPADTTLALGYVDMNYRANFAQVVARFPHATVVSVTASVQGTPGARVYDCERGDGNAAQAAQWAQREVTAGRRPCIYSSRIGAPGHGWPDVQHAVHDLGIGGQVDYGVADYTGVKHLLSGSVFTQWANPTYTHANYDISETDGVWPHQQPLPPGPLPITKEDEMSAVVNGDTIKVYCIRQNHLIEFTRKFSDQSNSVIDITAQIGGASPPMVDSGA
jgi:hypothetical protein